jgi:ribosomal protein S8/ribosomal protein S14
MLARLLLDRRRRILSNLYEPRRRVLRSLMEAQNLPARLRGQAYRALLRLPRDSSPTRIRNRCPLTGRGRAIIRRFGLSRIIFRSLAIAGRLVGVKKASWLYLFMDVLSNTLSILLNASRSRRSDVLLPPHAGGNSNRVREVLRLLTNEGYLEGLSPVSSIAKSQGIVARLKYNARGEPAIRALFRVSTPGRRVYVGASSLWQPPAGSGLLVLSTTQGLRSDRDARRFNLGGEVLRGVR